MQREPSTTHSCEGLNSVRRSPKEAAKAAKNPPPPPPEQLVANAIRADLRIGVHFHRENVKFVQKPSLTGSEFTFTRKICEIRPKPPTDASGASDCLVQGAR